MRGIFSIFLFLLSVASAQAAHLNLAWDPNGEGDLAGYRIYYGISSGEYINFVDVGKVQTYTLDNLMDGVTYYIAITAYDTAGNESDFSGEVAGIGVPDVDGDSPTDSDVDSNVVGESKEGGCFVSALTIGS